MAQLQVLSAPTNQPTLNPVVKTAPVQPVLSPRVITKPAQPVLAPKVVTQPQQPILNPQVETKPQGLGKITSIGTANEQQPYTPKLSLEEFGQLIKQNYPAYADKSDLEVGQAMIAKYPEYTNRINVAKMSPTSDEQGASVWGWRSKRRSLNTGYHSRNWRQNLRANGW